MLNNINYGKRCATSNLVDSNLCQGYVPLLLAIYDYWYIQRRRPKSESSPPVNGQTSRQLWSAIFLAAAYSIQVSVMSAPRSTYICPLSSSANFGVPLMQVASILVDCFYLVSISKVANTQKTSTYSKSDTPLAVVGSIFLVNSWYCCTIRRMLDAKVE